MSVPPPPPDVTPGALDEADLAHAVALASLSGMGPATLRRMLAPGVDAIDVWSTMRDAPPARRRAWLAEARRRDPIGEWQRARSTGIRAARWGSVAHPGRLGDDHEPPAVAFWRSRSDLHPDRLDGPSVAIVGTRRCTRAGRDTAHLLGRVLADAGVTVVSGLALGIDAAAHTGALAAASAPPLAVVGSGLDVVYPRANAGLWQRLDRHGVIVGEAPPGAAPEAWRFPARNRMIAAFADVVVVVESHDRGGSLMTAIDAAHRGREVMAVPGPITSPASAGSNALLRDGAHPVLGPDDVLTLLGLVVAPPPARPPAADDADASDPAPGGAQRGHGGAKPADDTERAVLGAIGFTPATLDQIIERSERPLGEVVAAVSQLELAGHLVRTDGWYERRGGG